MQGRNGGRQSIRKEACLHEFLGTITMSPKTRISTTARGSNMCKNGYSFERAKLDKRLVKCFVENSSRLINLSRGQGK